MEKDYTASTIHSEKALSLLSELQADNEVGALHRNFMLARLDSIEAYEESLKSELEKCAKEKEDIHKHSQDVGEERSIHRRKLARSVLDLLSAESGTITNRALLWRTIAEKNLAHYIPPERKEACATLLMDIDESVRRATIDRSLAPVLKIDKHPWLGKKPVATYGVIANDATGLGVSDEEYAPIVPLDSEVSSTGYTSEPRKYIDLPLNGIVRYHNNGHVVEVNLHDEKSTSQRNKPLSDSATTDILLGTSSIQAYIESLYSDDASKGTALTFSKLLYAHSPEMLTLMPTDSPLRTNLSRYGVESLLKKHESEASIASTPLGDFTYYAQFISTPEDRKEILSLLDTLKTPTVSVVRYALETSLPSV